MPDIVSKVTRAVSAFRAGFPVLIGGVDNLLALAVETATDDSLQMLRNTGLDRPMLVLTHARAQTLKMRLYTPEIAALEIGPDVKLRQLRAIADPTADLTEPMKGPFEALRGDVPANAAAAVKLAKLGGLLPAVIVARTSSLSAPVAVDGRDIENFEEEIVDTLTIVSRARVPLEGAEQAEFVAFRPDSGGPEHYAIIIGVPSTRVPVLLRLHSECFTGDLLGSLRCDCGEQLRGAIRTIAEAGGGILLYLAQEGRGIGLINKLRAYRLQDQGFDTLEANERLGFERDERLYGVAARMLELLGYNSVRLLTNNPRKVAALMAAGIDVTERIPHSFPSNEHNRQYLATKASKDGHLF